MTNSPLSIRSATPGDAPFIQAIYAPIVEKTVISFEVVPPTVSDMAKRIETTLRSYPFLAAERAGEVIGYAYAGEHRTRAAYRWSVDVSAYVAEPARRSGVGQALYRTLLPILAEAGHHAAFAGITLPNAPSVGLHEAMGFRPVGVYREVGFKFGQWLDVGWWQKMLGDQESCRS